MKSRRILKQWYGEHLGIEAHNILNSTKPMHTAAVREFAQQVLWHLESMENVHAHNARIRRWIDDIPKWIYPWLMRQVRRKQERRAARGA